MRFSPGSITAVIPMLTAWSNNTMSFSAITRYSSRCVSCSFKLRAAQNSKHNTPFKSSGYENTELIYTKTKKQNDCPKNVKN